MKRRFVYSIVRINEQNERSTHATTKIIHQISCASHHEDELYNAVADFAAANPGALDLRSNRVDVDNIDNIELDKVSLKTTYIQDSDTMNLEFDVLVVGELIFQEITRHDDFDDSCEAWFRVTCTAYLDGYLKDFKVLEVDTYDQNQGRGLGVCCQNN